MTSGEIFDTSAEIFVEDRWILEERFVSSKIGFVTSKMIYVRDLRVSIFTFEKIFASSEAILVTSEPRFVKIVRMNIWSVRVTLSTCVCVCVCVCVCLTAISEK